MKPNTKYDRIKLVKIVKRLRARRVAVVGDVMLDRYLWGQASRLSPEAAVPVVEFAGESACAGGAGNVAANLAALGAKVEAFGAVGEDESAEILRECLRSLAISEKGLVTEATRPTTVKTRIVARHQQVVRLDHESRAPLTSPTEQRLVRAIKAAVRKADALIVSDYDKGVVSEDLAARVLQECQKQKTPAFVKPKWSRLPKYPGATAIVLNRAEASFLVTRTLDSDETVEQAGRALLDHFGSPAVIITRGELGMSVFEQEETKAFHIAATGRETAYLPGGNARASQEKIVGPGRQVFDVTGAGDTVLATLALAVAAGATMREAAVLANAAAGIVVCKLGTATLSVQELLGAVSKL